MWVYTLPWSVAQLNALALLAPDSRAVLGRWMRWLVDAVRPDGAVPALGDGADRPAARFLESAAALCGDAEARALRDLLPYPQRLQLPEGLHRSYSGCAPALPAPRSAVYEHKGRVVLRDGWAGPDASHLMLSAARPPFNHGHCDVGHFVLFTRGHSFIGDPASHIYNGYHHAQRRGYMCTLSLRPTHGSLSVPRTATAADGLRPAAPYRRERLLAGRRPAGFRTLRTPPGSPDRSAAGRPAAGQSRMGGARPSGEPDGLLQPAEKRPA